MNSNLLPTFGDDKTIDVTVLGCSIIDCISYVPTLPKPGETLRASRYQTGFGGKGANQCVAAAKLGSKTALISKVGTDDWGQKYRDNLEKFNVEATHVETVNGSTGLAQINVSSDGENQIVIIPGASDALCPGDIDKAAEVIRKTKVLVCQLENPLQATLAALRMKDKNSISILNASPSPNENTLELFTLPTILCVNQVEAAALTRRDVPDIEEAKRAISNFLCLGCNIVIITLGRDGAIFASADHPNPVHVRAPRIEDILDTTGAGDAFVGALAHYLARYDTNVPLYKKIGGAITIASMTVQQYGTQTSYPSAKELRFDISLKNFDYTQF
ncbi:ribokinase [Contarinia nasturtii]|uniref:ribokinase n=1 Tax=Contarinia nasturtii TaxID=265458 RepID=UPI0012D3D594|nr:ribokinase [Contarinia nasturtii]